MNQTKLIVFIVMMAVITYLTRFPMLLISSRVNLPERLVRGLKMASLGVFSSLTIPPILFHHTKLDQWSPEYIIAGIVSLAVGVWRKQAILSLGAGVLCLILIRII